MPRPPLTGLLVLVLLGACDKSTTPTPAAEESAAPASELELEATAAANAEANAVGTPFADAELFFELNSTDNDLGLQLFLDAPGWKRVRLLDPQLTEIALFAASGRLGRLGITELRFESEEPSPGEVLALFPEGKYRFRGRTVEGQFLASNVELSHELPPPPTFTPAGGQRVDRFDTVVRWNAPGAETVEIIIESDALEHTLDVILSASTHRLKVPPQFLTPGEEYKIEILSIAENGNRTLAESTFRVRE